MSPDFAKLGRSLGRQLGFFPLPNGKVASLIDSRYSAIPDSRIQTPNFGLCNREREQRGDAIFWIVEQILVLSECLASGLLVVHPIFEQFAVLIPDIQGDVAREEFCAPNAHGHNRTKRSLIEILFSGSRKKSS